MLFINPPSWLFIVILWVPTASQLSSSPSSPSTTSTTSSSHTSQTTASLTTVSVTSYTYSTNSTSSTSTSLSTTSSTSTENCGPGSYIFNFASCKNCIHQCVPVRPPCEDGKEYLVAPPTKSSDRICKAISLPCRHGEYELSPATNTSDRECKPLTQYPDCTPGKT